MKRNPLALIAGLAAAIVGAGNSLIDWGDPDGVHGTGFPVPIRIEGLPDDAPAIFQDLSDLDFLAFLLNIGLVALAGVLIWAIIALGVRIFRGG